MDVWEEVEAEKRELERQRAVQARAANPAYGLLSVEEWHEDHTPFNTIGRGTGRPMKSSRRVKDRRPPCLEEAL